MKNFSKELKEILIKLNAPMYIKEIEKILDQAKKLEKTYLGWESLKTELEIIDMYFFDNDMPIYHCIANILKMMENIENGRDIHDFGNDIGEVKE